MSVQQRHIERAEFLGRKLWRFYLTSRDTGLRVFVLADGAEAAIRIWEQERPGEQWCIMEREPFDHGARRK